jgi:hypothetical protein
LPRLALNFDPPDLCFSSSWDYRYAPPHQIYARFLSIEYFGKKTPTKLLGGCFWKWKLEDKEIILEKKLPRVSFQYYSCVNPQKIIFRNYLESQPI